MSSETLSDLEIFSAALEINDPRERVRFLERACGCDLGLRAKVTGLIAAYDRGAANFNRFLSPDRPLPRELIDKPGTSLGGYRLREKIGEGGFGAVYLAEQNEPVKRQVALKVIKLGMDTRQVVARFEAERQALAMMDHPCIAKVFDGGATENGRPYFVMELVRGLPITKYCDENRLSTNQRLGLFLQVCDAVQHAHQKGIIHRDLKPNNVLIKASEGKATPKVIDFGIAKATQQALTEKTIVTELHQFMGTPAYVSPEQAQMTNQDIDTRSDIYSLGVLLYELLTGKAPFDNHELLTAGLDEMRRIIREDEPARPSTRQSKLPADLDWIVMRCLEKDRNRRYETASALASDIERHLKNEPVVACPPSNLYRFQKLIRRNTLAFAAAAAVGFALLGGMGAASWQAIRAGHAEQQQRLERARAEKRFDAAMRFFNQAFNTVSPTLGDIIGAARPKELLATAAAEALDDLRQDHQPDGEDLEVIGQLYLQLARSHGWFAGNTTGDYPTAWKAATNAVAMLESAADLSASDFRLEQLSWAELTVGVICSGLLRPQEAIEHHQKSHRWAARLGEQTTNSYFKSQSAALKGWAIGNIGDVLVRADRCEEAITNNFLPELARLRKRGNSDQSPEVLDVWDLEYINANLGIAFYRLERYGEALPYLREALRLIELINKRRPLSAQFSSTLALTRAYVGEVLLCLNQSDEGLQLLRDAKTLADDLAGRDPVNAGFSQAQIEVAWRSASGYATWANDASAPVTDRRARLGQAEIHLERTQTLLVGLKSDSLRKYLAADVRPVTTRIAMVKSHLDSKGGP